MCVLRCVYCRVGACASKKKCSRVPNVVVGELVCVCSCVVYIGTYEEEDDKTCWYINREIERRSITVQSRVSNGKRESAWKRVCAWQRESEGERECVREVYLCVRVRERRSLAHSIVQFKLWHKRSPEATYREREREYGEKDNKRDIREKSGEIESRSIKRSIARFKRRENAWERARKRESSSGSKRVYVRGVFVCVCEREAIDCMFDMNIYIYRERERE